MFFQQSGWIQIQIDSSHFPSSTYIICMSLLTIVYEITGMLLDNYISRQPWKIKFEHANKVKLSIGNSVFVKKIKTF